MVPREAPKPDRQQDVAKLLVLKKNLFFSEGGGGETRAHTPLLVLDWYLSLLFTGFFGICISLLSIALIKKIDRRRELRILTSGHYKIIFSHCR